MNKQYESLYPRYAEQDRTNVFAFFNCSIVVNPETGEKTFDPWLPYRKLAEFAHPEDWESFEKFEDGNRKFQEGNLVILANYLNFTFMRLQEEGKILLSRDGTKACFNTGLLDRRFGGDIHAFFGRNNRAGDGQPDWFFWRFATESSAMRKNGAGESLMGGFSCAPEAAQYYNEDNYRDLFFNLSYKTIIVPEHLIEDNQARLPAGLRGHFRLADTAIRGAVGKLYGQLQRNYKLAVPHWYEGHIQLLLPLCLNDSGKADLALVAERMDEQKAYVIQTILTMDMAYQDARLICRPDSDWLKVR